MRYLLIKILMGVFLVFMSHAEAITQSTNESKPKLINFIDFSFDLLNPIYSFDERLNKNLYGFSISYLRQRKPKRLDYFGVQYSYAHIGSITQDFFQFEDRTSTQMMSLRFLYRYYPSFFFWRVEPFLETSLGPQIVYTVTTTTSFIDDTASLNFEEFDMGLSYGVGLGFNLYITGQVFLLGKVNFNGGSSLTYYVPGDYVSGLPFDNFFAETSAINFINWQMGMSVSF